MSEQSNSGSCQVTIPEDPKALHPTLGILSPRLVWSLRAVPVHDDGKIITFIMDDPTSIDDIDTICHLIEPKRFDAIPVSSEYLETVMSFYFGSDETEGRRARYESKHYDDTDWLTEND